MGLKDEIADMLRGGRQESPQTTEERLENTSAAVRELQAAVVRLAEVVERLDEKS